MDYNNTLTSPYFENNAIFKDNFRDNVVVDIMNNPKPMSHLIVDFLKEQMDKKINEGVHNK